MGVTTEQHEFIGLLQRTEEAIFGKLNAGPFELCIQASRTHYCTPRKTAPTADVYSEFDMAIFEGDKWINPLEDERFSDFKDDLSERWESGRCPVGAYIPSELVQRMYDHCKSLKEE